MYLDVVFEVSWPVNVFLVFHLISAVVMPIC